MKPSILNILFSEPDVFSVLPKWPDNPKYCEMQCRFSQCACALREEVYSQRCEQSKANAIRIENIIIFETLGFKLCHNNGVNFYIKEGRKLKHGDIFQVEGFEYEVKPKNYQGFLSCCPKDSDCSCGEKVAVLKLAKEKCKLCGGLGYIVKDEFQKQAPECPVCFPSEEAKIKLAKEEGPKEQEQLFGVIHEFEQIGYNQAIDDVIEKLKQFTETTYPYKIVLMKRSMIILILAKDENVIPDILSILKQERISSKDSKASKLPFNKAFVIDNISRFYIKNQDRIQHCFNRFLK